MIDQQSEAWRQRVSGVTAVVVTTRAERFTPPSKILLRRSMDVTAWVCRSGGDVIVTVARFVARPAFFGLVEKVSWWLQSRDSLPSPRATHD